eukprot:524740-Pleurochrysis_carterae.AAC.1
MARARTVMRTLVRMEKLLYGDGPEEPSALASRKACTAVWMVRVDGACRWAAGCSLRAVELRQPLRKAIPRCAAPHAASA